MNDTGLANTKDLSVIVPSNLDQRMDWLKHRLTFLYRNGYQGETLVGVWRGHDKLNELLAFCLSLSSRIRVVAQDGSRRFAERVLELSEQTRGKHVIQIGDDDFLLPEPLVQLAEVLERDPSIVCAQGRSLFINSSLTLPLQIRPFPVWPALETDLLTRFTQYCTHSGQLFHAMFRRADFIERYRWMDEAMAQTKNDVWFEMIGEFYGVIKGRFFIVDEIFILRGKDANSESRNIRSDHRQFPFFLLEEDFSPTYKFFERQLFRMFTSQGVNVEDPVTRTIIRTGVLNIFGTAVLGRRADLPIEEVRLSAMLHEQPTPAVLERILGMVLNTKAEASQA